MVGLKDREMENIVGKFEVVGMNGNGGKGN